MAEVQGLNKLIEQLKAKAATATQAAESDVVVGYTAQYALYVHENRQMKWRGLPRRSGTGVYWGPKGRAGFLLDVAREMERELAEIVIKVLREGKTALQAFLVAGLRLQRESQKNVPVEYGNLRASAFTRLEKR